MALLAQGFLSCQCVKESLRNVFILNTVELESDTFFVCVSENSGACSRLQKFGTLVPWVGIFLIFLTILKGLKHTYIF